LGHAGFVGDLPEFGTLVPFGNDLPCDINDVFHFFWAGGFLHSTIGSQVRIRRI
jgi:hypothetical protein